MKKKQDIALAFYSELHKKVVIVHSIDLAIRMTSEGDEIQPLNRKSRRAMASYLRRNRK